MEETITYATFESRYKDRSYIGSGGFAKVYKVFDHAKNHYVALKVSDVRPEFKQFTLQREVELVNGLKKHRNIARYDACYRFNYGITGDTDFAVLKFYEAGNLEQFLKREHLSDHDKKVIIKGILQGLSFLHGNGVIHRDLKAQNILLSREDGVWTPKITDFGLAREMGGANTLLNSSIGITYAYAAPEQIKNEGVQTSVDLWSIGVIIYRIIMDELPFTGSSKNTSQRSTQSQLEISRQILNLELPDKLIDMPEPYRSMVRRCFVLSPKERAQSAVELLELLDGTPLRKDAVVEPIDGIQPVKSDTIIRSGDHATNILRGDTQTIIPPELLTDTDLTDRQPQRFDTEYEQPRRNLTHVMRDAPRPVAPPVVDPSQPLKLGGDRFGWLPYLAAVAVLGIMMGLYFFLARPEPVTPTAPVSQPGLLTVQPTLQSLGLLEQEMLDNLNNNAALAALLPKIETLIEQSPDDYRLHFLAARIQLYQKDRSAFLYLGAAANLAEAQGQQSVLLQRMESFSAANPRLTELTDSAEYREILDRLRN